MDEEGGRGVGALTEMMEWGDGSHEVSGGRGGPRFAVGGTDAIEKEGKTVPFFEEGEDELGAWVAGAHPA